MHVVNIASLLLEILTTSFKKGGYINLLFRTAYYHAPYNLVLIITKAHSQATLAWNIGIVVTKIRIQVMYALHTFYWWWWWWWWWWWYMFICIYMCTFCACVVCI